MDVYDQLAYRLANQDIPTTQSLFPGIPVKTYIQTLATILAEQFPKMSVETQRTASLFCVERFLLNGDIWKSQILSIDLYPYGIAFFSPSDTIKTHYDAWKPVIQSCIDPQACELYPDISTLALYHPSSLEDIRSWFQRHNKTFFSALELTTREVMCYALTLKGIRSATLRFSLSTRTWIGLGKSWSTLHQAIRYAMAALHPSKSMESIVPFIQRSMEDSWKLVPDTKRTQLLSNVLVAMNALPLYMGIWTAGLAVLLYILSEPFVETWIQTIDLYTLYILCVVHVNKAYYKNYLLLDDILSFSDGLSKTRLERMFSLWESMRMFPDNRSVAIPDQFTTQDAVFLQWVKLQMPAYDKVRGITVDDQIKNACDLLSTNPKDTYIEQKHKPLVSLQQKVGSMYAPDTPKPKKSLTSLLKKEKTNTPSFTTSQTGTKR